MTPAWIRFLRITLASVVAVLGALCQPAEAHRADSPPGPPPLLRRIDQSEGRTTVFVAAHERMPAALRAAWGSRGKKAELRVSGSTHEEARAVP